MFKLASSPPLHSLRQVPVCLNQNLHFNSSLAAYQLMMYFQHPFVFQALTPPQPMPCFKSKNCSVEGKFGCMIFGSGASVSELEEPSSDGTSKVKAAFLFANLFQPFQS